MAPRTSDSVNSGLQIVIRLTLSFFSRHQRDKRTSMRLPSISTIVRTFYAFSNSTARTLPASQRLAPFTRGTVIKSMPTIPFLSSFFGTTSSSSNMSYPLQKSDDEWQAVLNPGRYRVAFIHHSSTAHSSLMLTSPPRTIPHNPTKRYRSTLHRRLRQAYALVGRLRMRRLRRPTLQSDPQVQVRMRMACLFR